MSSSSSPDVSDLYEKLSKCFQSDPDETEKVIELALELVQLDEKDATARQCLQVARLYQDQADVLVKSYQSEPMDSFEMAYAFYVLRQWDQSLQVVQRLKERSDSGLPLALLHAQLVRQ